MLNIVQVPQLITFAKNDIIFRIRTLHPTDGAPYRARGARAALKAEGVLPIGFSVTLKYSETYTIQDSATFTISQANQTSLDLLEMMKNNPNLSPYLRFYEDGGFLVAEAIDTQKNWTIIFEVAPTTFTYLTTQYPKFETNAPAGYRVICDVFFEKKYNSNQFEKVATREILHREDGSDIFLNISEIMSSESLLSIPENPFSLYSRTAPTIADNVRRYYLRFTEITALGIHNTYKEDIRKVIIGGISNTVFLSNDFFNTINGEKAIFSSKPHVQNVRFGATSYISFFNNSSAERTFKLLIGYRTGANAEIQVEKFNINAEPFRTITFPINPDALGLPQSTRYYWVQILANDTLVSSTRHFVVDNTPYRSIRVLAYLNSFGVPDTTICTGGFQTKSVIEAENYQSVRGSTSAGNVIRQDRNTLPFQKNYVYRTGIITSKEKEALTELPLSPVLFDITTHQYLALNLKADRAQTEIIADSEESLFNYEFNTEPRIILNNFSLEKDIQETTLTEPQFIIEKGKGNPNPAPPEVIEEPWGTGGGGSGSETGSNAFSWEALCPISDTDLILFAKTDEYGKLIGYKYLKSGDYMRHIRGIEQNAPSHLDGVGFIDQSGNYILQYQNTEGDPMYKPKSKPISPCEQQEGGLVDDAGGLGDDETVWKIE